MKEGPGFPSPSPYFFGFCLISLTVVRSRFKTPYGFGPLPQE